MSSVNNQSINPEFRAWLEAEVLRLADIRDRFIASMNMELGRKNGEIEALQHILEGAQVVKPLVVEIESPPNGQGQETEVVSE